LFALQHKAPPAWSKVLNTIEAQRNTGRSLEEAIGEVERTMGTPGQSTLDDIVLEIVTDSSDACVKLATTLIEYGWPIKQIKGF
jgi:hypothetical protein